MTQEVELGRDFDTIANLSRSMSADRPAELSWEGSPFQWLKSLPSASRGSVGKDLAARWAAATGLKVQSGTGTDGDRLIQGAAVQIRMSTLWNAGLYKFQQIRDLDYDYLFCLGLSPHEVHAWLFPKAVLDRHVIGRMGQHTGSASHETAWIELKPAAEPTWARPYGNTLSHVHGLLTVG